MYIVIKTNQWEAREQNSGFLGVSSVLAAQCSGFSTRDCKLTQRDHKHSLFLWIDVIIQAHSIGKAENHCIRKFWILETQRRQVITSHNQLEEKMLSIITVRF